MQKQNLKVKNQKTDFRLLLQSELVQRCQRNPKYSLRAFARALGISASALSDMLNGKRTITSASIEKLGLAMGMALSEIEQFQSSQKLERAKQSLAQISRSFQQISVDQFSLIADWYHYAILELMKVKGFKQDPRWIAKKLNVSHVEVKAAIERLVRLGLIKINEENEWLDTSGGFSTSIVDSKFTDAASRRLQKQILEMSIKALEALSPAVRSHTSMTMAINSKDLDKANEKIKTFRREMSELLENSKSNDDVYQLSISFYPLTQV